MCTIFQFCWQSLSHAGPGCWARYLFVTVDHAAARRDQFALEMPFLDRAGFDRLLKPSEGGSGISWDRGC